jgi:hypothetical protein
LVTLGAVLVALGGTLFYLREHVFDAQRFAAHATNALDSGAARAQVSREVVTLALEQAPVPVAAARPLLEQTVSDALDGGPFRSLFRAAALQMHRILFQRSSGGVAFTLADVGVALIGAAHAVDPGLAARIPPQISVSLAHFSRHGAGVKLVELSYHVRLLGLLLPLLGLALWAAAIALSATRRRTVAQIGVGLALGAAIVYVGLLAGRSIVLGNVIAPELRPVAGAVWDAFLTRLELYALITAACGAGLFAMATSMLRRDELAGVGRTAAAALLLRPTGDRARAARAAALIALGALLVADPAPAVSVIVVLAGSIVVFYGVSELLELLAPQAPRGAGDRRRGPRARLATMRPLSRAPRPRYLALGALVTAGVVVAVASGGATSRRHTLIETCNGFAVLCDRPLDEVSFAATHNSMSADSEGFIGANQPNGILPQLEYGIRGFLIDSYYGVREGSTVRTVLAEKHASRKQLTEEVGSDATAAIERLTRGAGFPSPQDPRRRPYLCHVFCEAGATEMLAALRGVRDWLHRHPDNVLIFFIEDSVTPQDTARVFAQSGLLQFVYDHQREEQWPTLRQLISSGRKLLVLSENDTSGAVPWYEDGFSLVQETPYSFTSRAKFSCRPNRGTDASPLFLLNHWIDNGRPSAKAASEVNAYDVLLARARECEHERGLLPNLVAVDWYDRGDLRGVVNTLNGLPREARGSEGG